MASERDTRDASTYLAWQSHLAVRMQTSRLRASWQKQATGEGAQLADASGLILALWRLRLAGEMSRRVGDPAARVDQAMKEFDAAIPGLTKLRHVTMHFDEYALETERRRNTVGEPPRLIGLQDLWRFESDAEGLEWLEVALNYAGVESAARCLYDVIQHANSAALG